MQRRDALLRVATLMGGTLSAPTLIAVLEGCQKKTEQGGKETATGESAKLTADHQKLTDEAAETIIPKTSTPGAKEAGVGAFIVIMMNDCYPEKDRQHFMAGLESLDKAANDTYKNEFVSLKPAERTELLKKVEAEAHAQRDKQRQEAEQKKNQAQGAAGEEEKALPHYFFTLKELTLLGYFTSEPGATQALEYVFVPGRYEGCVDMKPGQKAWAL